MVKQHQYAHRNIHILQIVVDTQERIKRTGATLFRGSTALHQSLTHAFPLLHTTQHGVHNYNDCYSSNDKVAKLEHAQ
jgi:hypothetical protein